MPATFKCFIYKTFTAVCLQLIWSGPMLAQQLRFDHFDISNQLSQNNITHLCVDEIGYVWIATLEGLNRFDGYSTEKLDNHTKKRNTFRGNSIYSLTKGRSGNIWIVSSNGLNLYDASSESFKVFEFPNTIPTETVKILKQDNSGLLWISDGKNLSYFDKENLKFNRLDYDLDIESILPYDKNILVCGGQGIFSISVINGDLDVKHLYKESIFRLAAGPGEGFYGINGNEILRWTDFESPETILSFRETNLPPITKENINAIVIKEDEIWLGGTYPLVSVDISSKSTQIFTYNKDNPFSFKGYIVRNLEVDRYNNLWIGTSRHGLNLLEKRKNQFSYYNWGSSERDQDIDPVRSILKTTSGDILYAVDRFGIGILKKGGTHQFYNSFIDCEGNEYELKRVRSIFEDSEGTIWIGGLDGILIYNEKKGQIETSKCQNKWEWPYQTYVIKEFEKGILTISGKPNLLGIVDIKNNELKTHSLSDNGSSFGTIRDIVKDKKGNFWIALNNGILKLDEHRSIYKTVTTKNSDLSNDKVYNLMLTGDSLWIATNSGLNIYETSTGKVLKSFYQTDGLVNNITYSLKKDQNNQVWISTNNGISLFNIDSSAFTNFLEEDHFLDDAHYQTKSGEIFFGGYDGIISFSPDEIKLPKFKSEALIEKLYLLNEIIDPGASINDEVILQKSITKLPSISLKHTQNSFSFDFNAFPFNFPNNNEFRYRLIGQSDEWVYPIRSTRFASYSGLSPKEYTLQVQVRQGRKDWSEPKTLTISIIPPFWQRTWFQYLIYFVAILLAYSIYRMRVMNIRNRNKMLNRKVKEQTSKLLEKNDQILKQKDKIESIAKKLHEADEAKLRFFTNISHEFRTPLTLILGQLEHLNGKYAHQAIRSIKNNSLRLHRLVEQLIDLRKLDRDQMKLSVSNYDIVEFTGNIINSFAVAAREENIEIKLNTNQKVIMLWFDADKMDKILYNLISNALKYSKDGDSVSIFISRTQEEVTVSIKDEGIGIEENHIGRIFERYYRGDQNNIEGHGIGLSLVKNFVEIQHAEIQVNSELGVGTEFNLKFKTGRDHFDHKEILKNEEEDISYAQHESQSIRDTWEPFNAGKEILVVEDNAELGSFIKRVLSQYYNVSLVSNGQEAFDFLTGSRPELIISDIMMPKMDGMTLAEKLKENSSTSHIPIILLTAKNDPQTKIEAYEKGIEGFIEKPFSTPILLLRVNNILANRSKFRQFIVEQDSSLESETDLNQIDRIFWQQITGFINDNLSDPSLSVDDMSDMMNMSRASFYRKFKVISRVSPGDHLRKARLNRAKELIHESNLSIAQISESVGFLSISHFRRSFKKEFDKTPSELRNSFVSLAQPL